MASPRSIPEIAIDRHAAAKYRRCIALPLSEQSQYCFLIARPPEAQSLALNLRNVGMSRQQLCGESTLIPWSRGRGCVQLLHRTCTLLVFGTLVSFDRWRRIEQEPVSF